MKKNHYFAQYALCIIITAVCLHSSTYSQQNLYDPSVIQKIEIEFSESDWDYRLDTAKLGSDGYLMAKKVTINGIDFDSVGVKYKGNSSFDSTYKKCPFNISLDEFKDQSYSGYKTLKLANCFSDPSMIREVLSYSIVNNYMESPKANFAKIYINGTYIGIYSNVESINKSFCSSRFGSSKGEFFSCSPMVIPTPQTKSNLKYLEGKDSTSYFNSYELKSNFGWNSLVTLCDSLSNNPKSFSSILNYETVLWMLAVNTALVNLDSYTGVFCQNYYLYRNSEKKWNVIPWDYNMSFGGFPYVGSSNTSMGALSLDKLYQLSPEIHSKDPYWPLINIVMNDATLKRKYYAHLKTIVNEMFVNTSYKQKAEELRNLIKQDVYEDNNKFYSNEQFDNSLSSQVNVGNYEVPGIEQLISSRVTYLQSLPELTKSAPVYTIKPIAAPVVNSSVTVQVEAKDNSSIVNVELYVRFGQYSSFTRIPMYDDGKHNDNSANDGTYGANFTMADNTAHYYVYCENNDAGTYLPQRANKEYYTLKASAKPIAIGDIVINEFLASNSKGTMNENGEYGDWIELYNNADVAIDMSAFTMSDDPTKPSKYTFPQNTLIQPKNFLTIWADENDDTEQYIHCNFKLSSSGEHIILKDATGQTLDSIAYGAQQADISMGLCPDGSKNRVALTEPSFNAVNNCSGTMITDVHVNFIKAKPQPAKDFLTLHFDKEQTIDVTVINELGNILFSIPFANDITLDTSTLPNGVYFARSASECIPFTIYK